MAELLAQPPLSAPEYLDWELLQSEKHDFLRGEVFAMAEGSLRHNREKLASLKEYVLLDIEAARLEVYRRNAAARFELFVFEGADCRAELASIDWRGPVAALLD